MLRIDYDPRARILTINGRKFTEDFLLHFVSPDPDVLFRIVEHQGVISIDKVGRIDIRRKSGRHQAAKHSGE